MFQVTPKKKRVGLFKGEIWVDAETYLPVSGIRPLREEPLGVSQESGFRPRIRNPGWHGASDHGIESRVDTRLVGLAELNIRFSNFSLAQTAQSRFCPLGW